MFTRAPAPGPGGKRERNSARSQMDVTSAAARWLTRQARSTKSAIQPDRRKAGGSAPRRIQRNKPIKIESALRKPQSARTAALPQNCPTALRILPLLWKFVNTSEVTYWITRRAPLHELATLSPSAKPTPFSGGAGAAHQATEEIACGTLRVRARVYGPLKKLHVAWLVSGREFTGR